MHSLALLFLHVMDLLSFEDGSTQARDAGGRGGGDGALLRVVNLQHKML